MQFDGYNPSILEEPMPFTLPVPHPDTTFELSDLSFLPSDSMPMLTETREPRCRDVLENIPQWFVPGVTADDVKLHKQSLITMMGQGIVPSPTDEDIWARVQNGETPYLSSKEELFFECELPFVRKLDLEFGDESMLTGDMSFNLLDAVNPVLTTASADCTLIKVEIDDNDTRFWSDERLRAAVLKLSNPELRRLAMDNTEEESFF